MTFQTWSRTSIRSAGGQPRRLRLAAWRTPLLQAVQAVSAILTARRREHGISAWPDSRGLGLESRMTIRAVSRTDVRADGSPRPIACLRPVRAEKIQKRHESRLDCCKPRRSSAAAQEKASTNQRSMMLRSATRLAPLLPALRNVGGDPGTSKGVADGSREGSMTIRTALFLCLLVLVTARACAGKRR